MLDLLNHEASRCDIHLILIEVDLLNLDSYNLMDENEALVPDPLN
jgi:hypothetical protein